MIEEQDLLIIAQGILGVIDRVGSPPLTQSQRSAIAGAIVATLDYIQDQGLRNAVVASKGVIEDLKTLPN